MRVLVTGAKGMLGYALERSCPDGVSFVGADLPELDITDAASVAKVFAGARPDAVINAAAYTDVDGCEEHEDEATAVNGAGAGRLAAACAEGGAPLLQVSTDYVFDGRIPEPGEYGEDAVTSPLSAYGRGKLAGEQAVAAATSDHWIVRTQWLYGLNGKNFVETMLRVGAERPALDVVTDQVGSPTSTHDLAPALWRLIDRRPAFGVYHATNDGSCSWFDFAQAIFRHAGMDVEVRPTDSRSFVRPAPRPARSVLSCAKWRAALGEGLPPWEDALVRYLGLRTEQPAGANR